MKSEDEQHDFIAAHILLLEDSNLRNEVIELIKTKYFSAKEAFTVVIDKYINTLKDSKDKYLNERYLDFLDIKIRVINNLDNNHKSLTNLEECILYIDELLPSYLLNMSKNVKGIIARKGGFTSHSAIMCRSLGIPFVIANIEDDYEGLVIIDNDTIILNPTQELIESYMKQMNSSKTISKDLQDICLFANISNNEEIELVTGEFMGIGLYRTEFILTNQEIATDVIKQANIYLEALKKANGKPIIFRTFDIGDDKTVSYIPDIGKGVKNYYKYPKLFENQIEAILNASKHYPNQVSIMFPMIEYLDAYLKLKKTVIKKARELGIKPIKVGMMLETQKALINLEDFGMVDFLSIGTNDLCAELFNIKRDSVLMFEDIYEELAMVIKKIVFFANRNNIPLSICGELASKKEFAKKVIKLGIKKISISPKQINNIYEAISEVVEDGKTA